MEHDMHVLRNTTELMQSSHFKQNTAQKAYHKVAPICKKCDF